ncbi:helix-turn-helix domain-containing protein [Clostridium butyricum]|uniref:helix-turn-helix domain-containing protein n=1 Tax=Clostridium butyricum TaxID=1492 RepID=UPI0022E3A77A|nr:helix-turn-helix transcriptional regulator [Clostridium butyricum]
MLKEKSMLKENLTQSQLAKRIKISESYISKLENHAQCCNPGVNLILKLSKELDIDSIEVFLYFIKNKN